MSDQEPPEPGDEGAPPGAGKDPKDHADSRSEEEGVGGDHLQIVQAKLEAIEDFTRGVGFLKTIAGITGLNILLGLLGAPIRVIFGVQVAEFVALLGAAIGAEAGMIWVAGGAIAGLMIAGLFAGLSVLGLDRRRWAVYLGMSLYLLDALLCLAFGAYLELACHLFALHMIGSGLGGLKRLERLEAGAVAEDESEASLP